MKSFYLEDFFNMENMEDSLVKINIKCHTIQHLHHETLPKQYEQKTPPKENLIQLSYAFPDLFPTLLKGGKIPEGIEETSSPDPAVTSAMDARLQLPMSQVGKVSRKTGYSCIAYILSTRFYFFMKICLLEPRIKYLKSPHFNLTLKFVFWTFNNIHNECLDF